MEHSNNVSLIYNFRYETLRYSYFKAYPKNTKHAERSQCRTKFRNQIKKYGTRYVHDQMD